MPKRRPTNQHRATEPEATGVGYEVGYGRPPRHTRFQKGQSGNKSGRPKGSPNLATLIEKELNKFIYVTENGRRLRITKREAIAKQFVNRALSGDAKAMHQVVTFESNNAPGTLNYPDTFTIDVFNHDGTPVEEPSSSED